MDAAQEIIERAKKLPLADRRRVVEALGEDLPDEAPEQETAETDEQRVRRRAALRRFAAKGGTGHSDYTDVAGNKHKHLAEIYADKHLPPDRK